MAPSRLLDGTYNLAPLSPRVLVVLIFPLETVKREQSVYMCMGQVPRGEYRGSRRCVYCWRIALVNGIEIILILQGSMTRLQIFIDSTVGFAFLRDHSILYLDSIQQLLKMLYTGVVRI